MRPNYLDMGRYVFLGRSFPSFIATECINYGVPGAFLSTKAETQEVHRIPDVSGGAGKLLLAISAVNDSKPEDTSIN